MEKVELPNLATNEVAYLHANSGLHVAVAVRRRSDGAEDLVAFELQARVVDPQGATVSVDGVPAVSPPHAWSVSLDGIVEGRITMAGQVEAARREAAKKALRHRAALEAYRNLPG